MADLFDGTPDAPPTPGNAWYPDPIDVMNRVAARKAGNKPGWRWCRSEVVGRPPKGTPRDQVHFLVEGAVPVGVITRGKNKGWPKWPKERDKVVVTGAEVDAEVLVVEAETGQCHPCAGTGKTVASMRLDVKPTAYTYRTCERCHGSGRPKARPEVAC